MAAATKVVEETPVEEIAEKPLKAPKKRKEPKKGGAPWLGLLVAGALIIGLAAGAFALNIFGVRDRYLAPLVRGIPILNNIIRLPETETDPLAGLTREELAARVAALETQLEDAKAQVDHMTSQNEINVNDLARLQQYEQQQQQYQQDKEAFDRMIAENNPDAYRQFYESIAPQNAETLYREAVGSAQADRQLKNYIDTYSSMDAAKAADIFENLIATDMQLIVQILNGMDKDHRGEILAEMDAANAASVTKQLAPR
ncbi:MAG: hypothetical protein LBS62_10350 [Clostridiales bacterium]|nr:hypothetical protein [Clostridiales bacterium]